MGQAEVAVVGMWGFYDSIGKVVAAPETADMPANPLGPGGAQRLFSGHEVDFTLMPDARLSVLRLEGYSIGDPGRSPRKIHIKKAGRWRMDLRLTWLGGGVHTDTVEFAWDGNGAPLEVVN